MSGQLLYDRPRELNTKNLYIVTKSNRLKTPGYREFDEDENSISDIVWRDKAKRLQARRWRKIKHQLV